MEQVVRQKLTPEEAERFRNKSYRLMTISFAILFPVWGYHIYRSVVNKAYNDAHKNDVCAVVKQDDSTLIVHDDRFVDDENMSDKNPKRLHMITPYKFAKNKDDSLHYAVTQQDFAELIASDTQLVTHRFQVCGCSSDAPKVDTVNIVLQ